MHDLMVMCDELGGHELNLFRSRGNSGVQNPEPRVDNSCSAVAENACDALAILPSQDVLDAIRWATGLKEDRVVAVLAGSLPLAVQEEQLELYKNRSLVPKPVAEERVFCNPNRLNHKNAVCLMLHGRLRSSGYDPSGRMPHNFIRDALNENVVFSNKKKFKASDPNCLRTVRRWYTSWLADGGPDAQTRSAGRPVTQAAVRSVGANRQRRYGAGRIQKNVWIRDELYAWFVAMRYSIDWKALEDQRRSCGAAGHRKCMGRFPRRLLLAKVEDLLARHCHESLVRGVSANVFVPSSKWFARWQKEYGLSMRKPNRKYKVPKCVLEERLKLWWTSIFRIRALCVAIHGYDPELENWDQSPFHNNESGSQNLRTLAVRGKEVPLIEGHDDTRERWTANFTTWSNKQRIIDEGPPYCELCFKAQPGEKLERRLDTHIRSRGYGNWLTVITAPKGSYRETDVLNFVDKHLPRMTPGRRWRIIMADDYGPHKSQNLFRLCWQRGYVLIVHGGGATPVAQTVDTDYNQHAKREYTNLEARELISQFRGTAVAVPKVKQESCCDLMHSVACRKDLHMQAAEGYKRTGASIDLDGLEDNLVVREAGVFWRSLHMRQHINQEIKMVRQEAAAGRLTWTQRNIQNLICQYPPNKVVDEILARQGDDNWLPEGECAYHEPTDGEVASMQLESDGSEPDGGESAVADNANEDDADDDGELSMTDVGEADAEERTWGKFTTRLARASLALR